MPDDQSEQGKPRSFRSARTSLRFLFRTRWVSLSPHGLAIVRDPARDAGGQLDVDEILERLEIVGVHGSAIQIAVLARPSRFEIRVAMSAVVEVLAPLYPDLRDALERLDQLDRIDQPSSEAPGDPDTGIEPAEMSGPAEVTDLAGLAGLAGRSDPVRSEELLLSQLRTELASQGSAAVEAPPAGLEVAGWRAAARRAARQLGRPIRTGQHPDESGAWAMLTDWPATPQEAAVHQAQMRRAIESLPTYGLPPPRDT